jgi:hypothetical protein
MMCGPDYIVDSNRQAQILTHTGVVVAASFPIRDNWSPLSHQHHDFS